MRRINKSAGQKSRKKDFTPLQVVILLSAFLNLNFKSVLGRSAALAALDGRSQIQDERLDVQDDDSYSGHTTEGLVNYYDEYKGQFSPFRQTSESNVRQQKQNEILQTQNAPLKNWLQQRLQEQVKYMHNKSGEFSDPPGPS